MKKTILATYSLLACASIASAQFSALLPSASNAAEFAGIKALVDANTNFTSQAGWGSAEGDSFALTSGDMWDIIFIGELAGWELNDLDIVTGQAAPGVGGSTTNLFTDIDTSTTSSGSFRRLTVDGSTDGFFDMFLDSTDSGGANGGRWSLFNGALNTPASASNYAFTSSFDATTVLFAFEDFSLNALGDPAGHNFIGDGDRNDFVFALRYVGNTNNAVPEPSTYGIIGAIALLGLIAVRRMKVAKA
jgi:hypothetical protein